MNFKITLQDILDDESTRYREFPITSQKIYLAHAAVNPLPTYVSKFISDYMLQSSHSGQFEYLHREIEIKTRQQIANLIGASSEEIAFIPSTSAGLNIVATGLDWKPGENIVIADGDFPANIYPWLNLQHRGVKIKYIPRILAGAINLEDIAAQIDENTRLVSLSTIHFCTGVPIDVDVIGEFLHRENILFCLDGIQSLGAFPCSIQHVDFIAADAHKWLLGPQGIGFLFIKREHFDRVKPIFLGWKSVDSPNNFGEIQSTLADTARRYEPGSLNIIGLAGLHAALTLILEIGVPAIANRLIYLRSRLIYGLEKKGYNILGIPSVNIPTGITSFSHFNRDIVPLYKFLDKEKNIVVSLREDLSGRKCIRVSPHFYNTEDEVDRLLQSL